MSISPLTHSASTPPLDSSFRQTAPAARIHAGEGALGEVAKEAERLGAKRAFVICGATVARNGLLDQVATLLGERFAGAFTQVGKESPLPAVQDCVAAARSAGADLLIAIGGGSAVVTTRSVAILLAEEGPVETLCTQYLPGQPPHSPKLLQPKLPNLLVLTTPTTAANWGGGAVRDPVLRRRFELFDPKARPAAVILDPDALLTAPLSLYLNAAVTTYCATAEGLLAPALNGFAQADLVQALSSSLEYLPALLRTPEDGHVRMQLAVAALLRNRATDALSGNRGHFIATGLVHALQSCYDHFPQGYGMAAVLGPSMRFTARIAAPGHANLAAAFGLQREGPPDMEAVSAACMDFLQALDVPVRLRDLDIPRAGLPGVAEEAMSMFFIRAAPRPLANAMEALALLEEAW